MKKPVTMKPSAILKSGLALVIASSGISLHGQTDQPAQPDDPNASVQSSVRADDVNNRIHEIATTLQIDPNAQMNGLGNSGSIAIVVDGERIQVPSGIQMQASARAAGNGDQFSERRFAINIDEDGNIVLPEPRPGQARVVVHGQGIPGNHSQPGFFMPNTATNLTPATSATPVFLPTNYIGVRVISVDPIVTKQLGLKPGFGLTVAAITPDSPAANAGIETHDILLKFEDQFIINGEQLQVLASAEKPGAEVSLTVLRGGKEVVVKVEIAKRPEHGGVRIHALPAGQIHVGSRPEQQQAAAGWPGFSSFGATAGHVPGIPPVAREVTVVGASLQDVQQSMDEIKRRMEELQKHGLAPDLNAAAAGGSDAVTATASSSANNRRIEYSENGSRLVLKTVDGDSTLTVTDKQGNILYDGPLNTDEDRAGLPPRAKAMLDKVESSQHIEFRLEEGIGPKVVDRRSARSQSSSSGHQIAHVDDRGHAVLTTHSGGEKSLKVTGKDGVVLYDGPVNTDEERDSLPAAAKSLLEKLEARAASRAGGH